MALGLFSGAGESRAEGPSLVDLARRAEITEERLLRDPAQWEVTARTGAGVRYHLRVVSAPPDFEVRMLVEPAGQDPHRFARVISRDGKWYVDELGGVQGVYRPWEVPFSFEIAPLLLSEMGPRTYELEDSHRVEAIDGAGVVLVRVPLAEDQRLLAEAFLEEAARSVVAPVGELAANIKEIRERLAGGNLLRIDAASGMVRTTSIGTLGLEFGSVQWLEERPELPALNNLPDFSGPLDEKRDGLVMIGHFGAWKPGATTIDPGGRLLNLDTGKLVRIPFVGGTCVPGCFVGDRSRVVVSGLDARAGRLALYLIDLETGAQRPLGGEALALGDCHAPILSPDGKTLAVEFAGVKERPRERRIFLVDLESGAARPVSEPFEGYSFSWLPDGSGLVGLIRQVVASEGGSETINDLMRLEFDGSVTELRRNVGRFAEVAGPNREKIFFQGSDLEWFTCDLDGENVKKVKASLRTCTSPSVSPDGKRVLLIDHQNARTKGMRPVVLDLATGEVEPVEVEAGWWDSPAWR